MATKTFYGIACQQDTYIDRPVDAEDPPRGPIVMEAYLNALSEDRATVQAIIDSGRFNGYGWVRIATITVDIPEE